MLGLENETGSHNFAIQIDGAEVYVRKVNCRRLYFSHTLAYMSLFSGTNKINRGEGNFVSCKDYASGYSRYVYNLSLDLDENDHFDLIR